MDLEVMSQARNYRNWMYHRIEPFIGQRILEVGAGIGNFTELLVDRNLVVATDKNPECVNYLKSRLSHASKVIPTELDLEKPIPSNFAKYAFDTVICLNVLEHVKEDGHALQCLHSILVSGGRLVLLVPAFQYLFGSIDHAIGHYRRYRKKTLLPKMRQVGFTIEDHFYMNLIGIAGWFWNNRVIKIAQENPSQIALFDRRIAPWAEQVERILPPPIGLSLIAIGYKG